MNKSTSGLWIGFVLMTFFCLEFSQNISNLHGSVLNRRNMNKFRGLKFERAE